MKVGHSMFKGFRLSKFWIRPTAALSIIFSFGVLALCYPASKSDAKSDPRSGWTTPSVMSGACVTERDYNGFKLAIASTAQKYAIILSIEGKQTDVGRIYEGKLSFPATYENRITGSGSEDNAIIFDDVFPTIFYSFSVKKQFTFYLDGYSYGPFDLEGSQKAIDDLNECKSNLTKALPPATSENLFSYFSKTDEPPEASIDVSPCTGEIVPECISHNLSCDRLSGGELEFKIVLSHFETIAPFVITGISGQGKVELKLSNRSVPLAITSIRVNPNDMDGGWIATVGLGTVDDFFEALSEKSSEGASLVVAGQRFSLAPQKGDGKKLVSWKDACIALEQPLPASSNAALKPDSIPAASKSDCPFNSQLFRSPLYKDANPGSYQELQFVEGEADGKVRLTEYRDGTPKWTAQGEFTCSNGFSICRIEFPLMLHDPVQLPYETVGSEHSEPELVVIPELRQDVYQQEQSGDLKGKSHRGLVADLLNGFAPSRDGVVAPYNVYRYKECAKSP
jgi:hypothetical protein